MASQAERAAMRRAVELAGDQRAMKGPNPRVGAVLLATDGSVVGEGFHRGAGTDHAEVVALRQAGDRARGGTAVVSLEPCNHHGRTGPCTQALISAGISRVIFGQSDRGGLAGDGAETLHQAGIDVEGGVLGEQAAALNPLFTRARQLRRPFVTYKFAASLDGRVAASDGTSHWITGELARQDVHQLRAESDAIVVGTGTALADNPSLTVRGIEGCHHRPLRVVMGSRDLPADAALNNDAAPTVRIRHRDPVKALDALAQRGVQQVLLEGGPTVAASFVTHRVVDRVVGYFAPVLLGSGPASLADAGIRTLADAPRFARTEVIQLGTDVRVTCWVEDETVPEGLSDMRGV